MESDKWHIYLIRTGRGALYAGITTDVARRLEEHRGAGRRGAKCLRSKGPFELVYQAEVGSRALALKVERRIKRLPKRGKEALVFSGPQLSELLDLLGIEVQPEVHER